jgi:hypothetical protein
VFFIFCRLSSSLFCKNRGIQFSLSLSWIRSFLFHSCTIRARQSSPSVLFKTSDHNASRSNTHGFYNNTLKTDPRPQRRGQQIEIFRHQRHGQFRGSLGVPENHRHRVRENADGERVGDTKREKNARTPSTTGTGLEPGEERRESHASKHDG